ncbi:hypothetical protein NRI_0416 [Neorickettsia risticii str. Illinois]|uniref:Uncharacterized protein n=1 Tax=Neorickettsia risticii (strain Illinois) TaxID=434131 RepID=C6V4T2_NEORI|nr:hypothetical protein NRI_0416 [Neorickettsia risticii str. Illinois]
MLGRELNSLELYFTVGFLGGTWSLVFLYRWVVFEGLLQCLRSVAT